ncbi:MAG: Fic family protein [Candidatus Sumerlaeia bacterium]|nr:Fic family protein [Candidatus Sumerlaeia bacterium]
MSRAGVFIKQPSGYRAFTPAPLPPHPAVAMDADLVNLLSQADRVIGRLDMVTEVLPNPDLFIGMYVRQEAVLSSQIEGTQSTLEDILQYEIDASGEPQIADVQEVVNYVAAMNHGLSRLPDLPLSLRLLKEIHEILLRKGRGKHSTPGEFRRSQNWVGPPGSTLMNATFVPPPVPEMMTALGDLEKFLHTNDLPVLIQAGLAHAQFETIHPFLDGNGRVGRLLITLLLCEKNVLKRPTLYLSHFFKIHRLEYYDRLTAIRQAGDWEGWLRFFLRGVAEVGTEAVDTTRKILALRDAHLALLAEKMPGNSYTARALDHLFASPMTTVRRMESHLSASYKTANKIIGEFESLGLLREIMGYRRNRVFAHEPYLALFPSRRVVQSEDQGLPEQTTEAEQ